MGVLVLLVSLFSLYLETSFINVLTMKAFFQCRFHIRVSIQQTTPLQQGPEPKAQK